MKLLIIRHGQSIGNAEGRLQGHADFPLTEEGQAQAQILGAWLTRRAFTWHAAYCSPLARANQTAHIALNTTPQNGPSATPWDALKEIDVGELAGLNVAEIRAQVPAFFERVNPRVGDFEQFGGESVEQVQVRAANVYETLLQRHHEPKHTVIVVAHGGFNHQLAKHIICDPVPTQCGLRYGNCTGTLIHVKKQPLSDKLAGIVLWHVPIELMEG